MAKQADPQTVQLATRIPKSLHRALKLEAIAAEVTLEAWIEEALESHLARVTGRPRTATPPGRASA